MSDSAMVSRLARECGTSLTAAIDAWRMSGHDYDAACRMLGKHPIPSRSGAVPEAQPVAWGAFPAGPRDWAEDFAHENGQYACICCECKQQFIGHKRRVVCKACVAEKEAIPAPDAACERCASNADVIRVAGEMYDWYTSYDGGPHETVGRFLSRLYDAVAKSRTNTTHPDARRDSARLDWLQSRADGIHVEVHKNPHFMPNVDTAHVYTWANEYHALAMRDAIDLAMRAEP